MTSCNTCFNFPVRPPITLYTKKEGTMYTHLWQSFNYLSHNKYLITNIVSQDKVFPWCLFENFTKINYVDGKYEIKHLLFCLLSSRVPTTNVLCKLEYLMFMVSIQNLWKIGLKSNQLVRRIILDGQVMLCLWSNATSTKNRFSGNFP